MTDTRKLNYWVLCTCFGAEFLVGCRCRNYLPTFLLSSRGRKSRICPCIISTLYVAVLEIQNISVFGGHIAISGCRSIAIAITLPTLFCEFFTVQNPGCAVGILTMSDICHSYSQIYKYLQTSKPHVVWRTVELRAVFKNSKFWGGEFEGSGSV